MALPGLCPGNHGGGLVCGSVCFADCEDEASFGVGAVSDVEFVVLIEVAHEAVVKMDVYFRAVV